MSSDKIERKRRSEIDTSDYSSDESPAVKVRRLDSTKNIGKIVTEACKTLLNWITPNFLKNMTVRGSLQTSSSSLRMGAESGARNQYVEDDDDDEIAVIAVNGATGARSRTVNVLRVAPHPKNTRSSSICPLASTPNSLPLTPDDPFSKNVHRIVERRKMNGFSSDGGKEESRLKKSTCENSVAPITNPRSEIEILLQGEIPKEKEIEIISEVYSAKRPSGPTRKTRLFSEPRGSRKDKTNFFEDFINSSSRSFSSTRSYTANEVVRLQERAQYKLLLDKVVKRTLYRPAFPKKSSQTSAIQVDLTVDDDDVSEKSYHFKKEKVEMVDDFLNKYYKPCSLVPHTAKTESQLYRTRSVVEKEKIDEEVQIIEYPDLPKLKPRRSTSAADIFSNAWLEELKMTLASDTERTLQNVAKHEEKIQRYKKRRDAKIAEEARKREEQRLAGIVFDEDVEMEEDVLPEITPEMEIIITNALGPGERNEQLSSLDRLTVTRNDISTLSNLNWLNDQVINFYLALIAERSKNDNFPSVHVFNSFFYTSLKTRGPNNVLRWTRRIDIFSHDLIIVPLHLEMHWALLVIDNRSKRIKYYDSMGSGEDRCLRIIQNYLITEMQDKKKTVLDPNSYSLEIPKDIPKQMNGSDCGMFTLKYAEYLSRDAPISFTQENMPYFRRRMVYELLSKQIL